MTNEQLAIAIKNGRTDLTAELWSQIEKLTVCLAKRFYLLNKDACVSMGVEVDDLTQTAYFALLDAIKYYSDEREYKFNTYLTRTLKRHWLELAGLDNHCLSSMRNDALRSSSSLDAEIADETDTTFAETIVDENAEHAFEEIENEELKADLNRCLATLTDVQAQTLKAYYCDEIRQTDYARQRGVTRMSVKRSLLNGLSNLRKGANWSVLSAYSC